MQSIELLNLVGDIKIKTRDIPIYKIYLRELFKDLSNRDGKQKQKISKITFLQFFKIHMFIGEKLFGSFCKKKTNQLEFKNFSEGMVDLFSGDIEGTSKIVFDMYDFNSKGNIKRENVKLLLSCIPNEYFSCDSFLQNDSIGEIKNILEMAFKNKDKLDYHDFLLIIQKDTSIFLIMLRYLYQNKPFSNENVNQFKYYENNSIIINNETDDYTDSTIDSDENISINKPKVNLIQEFNRNEAKNENSLNSTSTEITMIIEEVKLNFQEYVYKICKNGKVKKYWLKLIDNEIYYYKENYREDIEIMHSLSGCFIEKNGIEYVGKLNFYCFSIIFPSKTRNFYTLTLESNQKWVFYLKRSTNYRNIFDYYEIKDEIGNGSFGSIKMGIDKNTKEKVAIKIIKKKNNHILELAYSEIEVMKRCKHTNVVKFIDFFENSKIIFIIMEYLPGFNLSEFIRKKKKNSRKNRC